MATTVASSAGAVAARIATRILIVEDDVGLRGALAARLEANGCSVDTTGDGVSARWLLLAHDYDAILLDLGLPARNGLDVLLEVGPRKALPPVLVLTGAGPEDRELARTLGAAHVLQKPCPHWLLLDAIESVLED